MKPGEDALKFGLNGQYRLRITPSGFILEDIEEMVSKCYWPYKVVRNYAKFKTGKEFEITVGRKNILGVGTVLFSCCSRDDLDEMFRLLPGTNQ